MPDFGAIFDIPNDDPFDGKLKGSYTYDRKDMGGPDAKWGGTLEDMDALEEQYIEILEECGFVEKKLEAFLGGILRTYYVKDNIAVSVNQSKNFSWLYVDIQEM